VDSGSSLNIINLEEYERMHDKPALRNPICNAYRFDSNKPIKFIGRFKTTLKKVDKSVEAEIHVLKYTSGSPNILSYDTSHALGIITVVNSVEEDMQKREMKTKYPALFSGEIGCLKNFELKLFEDKSVKPSKRFHYRIPYHLQKQVAEHLDKNEKRGLIERATGPTSWISASHVVPKKDGRIRLVIDGRPVNKAIIRHRHITPTLDDIASKLSGAARFSKVDLQEAYRQIKLAPESRHLTTFSTHQGLYRDTRLSMGMNAAAENFQWIVAEQIKDLKGCFNVSDDIIVHGKSKGEHDKNLHALLAKLESVGFTCNLKKCEFDKSNIDFFGVNFSAQGMSPSESRVEAFQKASAPVNASELRSLLASANYSSRFVRNFASMVVPLRELTKPDVEYNWTSEHDKLLAKLKAQFTTNKLGYFNPKWLTEVICDASPDGLGAILVQVNPDNADEKKVIAFASRALTPLEKKYSQIEREALALIFAVEKFHQYVYGKHFTLYSDAKAIVFIYGNMTHKSPARIERWGLRLLPYNFTLVHTPGDSNPADYLSRHPVGEAEPAGIDADLYVNFIIDSALPNRVSRTQIAKATREDPEMQTLIRAINTNNHGMIRKDENLKEYSSVFNELTVSTDGIVLRKNQIVVPQELRSKMVDIAHEGHLGIVKTKNLMRLKVWFPRINHMVESKIGGCIACQSCTPSNSKNMVPLRSEPVPKRVWSSVGGDFFGPLPSGHYLLSIVCKTSGFPVVEVISSTSARTVIPVFDRIFSEFGIPETFGSDNGPPFQGHEFKRYCEYMGIRHQRATPYWPQGNAKCERLMKSLGKLVRTAQVEKKPWRQCLNQFLRSYRAAPHSSTGLSPNQLMFGRNISSRLPESKEPVEEEISKDLSRAIENCEKAADRNRAYGNKRRNTKASDIKLGDTVLVKQAKVNKLTSPFNPDKLTVTSKQGSWVVGTNSAGKDIARNVSFFKKLPESIPTDLKSEAKSSYSDNDKSSNEYDDQAESEFETPEGSQDIPPLEVPHSDAYEGQEEEKLTSLNEQPAVKADKQDSDTKLPSNANQNLAVESASEVLKKRPNRTPAHGDSHEKRKAAVKKSKSQSRKRVTSKQMDVEDEAVGNRPRREGAATVNYKESRSYIKKPKKLIFEEATRDLI